MYSYILYFSMREKEEMLLLRILTRSFDFFVEKADGDGPLDMSQVKSPV